MKLPQRNKYLCSSMIWWRWQKSGRERGCVCDHEEGETEGGKCLRIYLVNCLENFTKWIAFQRYRFILWILFNWHLDTGEEKDAALNFNDWCSSGKHFFFPRYEKRRTVLLIPSMSSFSLVRLMKITKMCSFLSFRHAIFSFALCLNGSLYVCCSIIGMMILVCFNFELGHLPIF